MARNPSASSPERLRLSYQAFQIASGLGAEERHRFLHTFCGGDLELISEVQELLELEEAESPLDTSPAPELARDAWERQIERASDDGATRPPHDQSEPLEPSEIGGYRVLRRLGEGGVGEVFLAEQREPIRRLVALKLIKPGMDSRAVLSRFESERQALALMEHPGVAGLFDCGITDEGRPYLVMEYIQGTSITEFCERNELDTRARLELFANVCDVVQHAHQKGVLHRDLKPANVLVVRVNGLPVPKVIDFGIAKALNETLSDAQRVTRQGQLLGTPEYMSPEQAERAYWRVDTRSDVYSLGVLLYELLTGDLPFEPRLLRSLSPAELERTLRESEPPSIVQRAADAARDKGRDRVASPGELEGDLDWIVRCALDKEPDRRYPSAAALAADVRRHLAYEPISASPPSSWYRLRKLLRRRRLLAGAVASCLAALFLGLSLALVQARRAKEAERVAQLESRTQAALSEFLMRLLRAPDALAQDRRVRVPRDVRVVDVLEDASREMQRFAGDPLVESALQLAIGGSYDSLGYYHDAELHLERSLEMRERELGRDALPWAEAALRLGDFHRNAWDPQLALELVEQAVSVRERHLGAEHPATLAARTSLGKTLSLLGRYDEARDVLDPARVAIDTLGRKDQLLLDVVNAQAGHYFNRGAFRDATRLYRDASEIALTLYGPEHSETLGCMQGVALSLERDEHWEEAEQVLDRVIQTVRETKGDHHPLTISARLAKASMFASSGRVSETRELLRQLRSSIGTTPLPEPTLLHFLVRVSSAYRSIGDLAGAGELLREADGIAAGLPADHPYLPISDAEWALLHFHSRRFADAHASLDRYERAVERADLRDGLLSFQVRLTRAQVLYGELKMDQAAELGEALLAELEARYGIGNGVFIKTKMLLLSVYIESGRTEDAVALIDELAPYYEAWEKDRDVPPVAWWHNVAFFYYRIGDHERAHPFLEKNYQHCRSLYGETHSATLLAKHQVLSNLAGLERHAEAVAGFRSLIEDLESEIEADRIGQDDTLIWAARSKMARSLVALGQDAEAEPLLLACADHFEEAVAPGDERLVVIFEALATVCDRAGREDEAQSWRMKIPAPQER